MMTLNLKVGGMSCMGCVNSVKNLLAALPGVGGINIDLASGQVDVEHDPAQVAADTICAAIEDGGYEVIG